MPGRWEFGGDGGRAGLAVEAYALRAFVTLALWPLPLGADGMPESDGSLAGDVFSAGEDEGVVTFAAALGSMFDFAPEAYEIVDGGDGGDSGHVVDAHHGDEIDGHDEPSPMDDVPAVVEDGEADGNDLDYRFKFAYIAGLDGEAFGRGDGAEACDEKFSSDDEDGDPGFDDVRVVLDESDVSGGDEQLIGKRIEQHAHCGDLASSAGEEAINSIGDGNKDEEGCNYDFLLAVKTAMREVGREHPDEDGDRGDAAYRDGVGQIHRFNSARVGLGPL